MIGFGTSIMIGFGTSYHQLFQPIRVHIRVTYSTVDKTYTVKYPISERGPSPKKPFALRDPLLAGTRLYALPRQTVARAPLR
jgi:hypothetical protein